VAPLRLDRRQLRRHRWRDRPELLGGIGRRRLDASRPGDCLERLRLELGLLRAHLGRPARTTFGGTLNKKQPSRSFSLSVGSGQAAAKLQFSKLSTMTVKVQSASGSVVGSASGPSVLTLLASLPAGTYTYVVSGSGSASFTLAVSYTAP
jgi:hypothetical protein